MTVNANKAFQYETNFLAGVQDNFEQAKGKDFRGSIWQHANFDESDRLRAMLAKNRKTDRELLKSLPSNRRIALFGFKRRFGLFKRATGVAIASVLSPLSHYASSEESQAPPIGLGELTDHIRTLVRNPRVPHIIGICSPTGFTDEALRAKSDVPNTSVILIEPDGHGGWRTSASDEKVDPRLLKIFDPEGSTQKIDRVRSVIDEYSAELLTGGLSASTIANRANLPISTVKLGFEQVARTDPELKFTKKDGEFLLYRGAPVQPQENRSMNVVDRIKQLFSKEGREVEKINLLSEKRAGLSHRRDRIYDDIGKLEKQEATLFEEGKAATSQVPKRRIAAQLNQLRKNITRHNATAAMLNKQIDIISTDVHNLTLIQQGQMAQLPDTIELTENAVRAEELMEELNADADLVGSLETGMEESLMSEEEMAILKEFEGPEPAASTENKMASTDAPAAPQSAPPQTSQPTRDDTLSEKTDESPGRADAEPS